MIIKCVSVKTAQCILHCEWRILPPDRDIKMEFEEMSLRLWIESGLG